MSCKDGPHLQASSDNLILVLKLPLLLGGYDALEVIRHLCTAHQDLKKVALVNRMDNKKTALWPVVTTAVVDTCSPCVLDASYPLPANSCPFHMAANKTITGCLVRLNAACCCYLQPAAASTIACCCLCPFCRMCWHQVLPVAACSC